MRHRAEERGFLGMRQPMVERCRKGLQARSRIARAAALLLAGVAAPALALDFSIDGYGITGALRTQVAAGAAMRMQDRDVNMIGKLNLPGQEQFCEDKQRTDGQPNHSCSDVAG